MDKKIFILVEGQTEQAFVKRVLAGYFRGIASVVATINTTKYVRSGANFKGGITSYNRVKREIFKLLQDTSATVVTTMFDYYGLPGDFPGLNQLAGDCYGRVESLEKAIEDEIQDARFIPYLQLHEFEALLFSAPQTIDNIMVGALSSPNLRAVKAAFHSPEEINNSPATCPSRRILDEYPGYEKILHGQIISENIGIETFLKECPHFYKWIEKLKAACTPPPHLRGQSNSLF